MMGVAQAVGASIAEIGVPEVVNGAAEEIGQDADGIEGLRTTSNEKVPRISLKKEEIETGRKSERL